VAILVGGFVARRVAARLKVPLDYHEYPRQPDGIIDERFGFNLASVDDVQNVAAVLRRTGRRSQAEASDDSDQGHDQRWSVAR
jgi:hypothetical protein